MPSSGYSRRTVVAIDDNPDDLLILTRMLAKAGTRERMVTFTSSSEALAHLRTAAESTDHRDLPHAVLVDGQMPELDGFDVLKSLRMLPAFADVKLVMVSGSERPEDRTRAARHGADAYFAKFPPAEMLVRALGCEEAWERR